MIQTPPHMLGCEHFTFHMGGPTEVMLAGTRFVEKGYQSFWGPGRHQLGSNWFWYFNSPLGCHVEYDADMDLHDDTWRARELPMGADSSQLFLFQYRAKWGALGAAARRRAALRRARCTCAISMSCATAPRAASTRAAPGRTRCSSCAGATVCTASADARPHQGTPMAWRKDAYLDAAGERIVCAAHGAQFEIDSGLCTLGPVSAPC